MQCNNVSTYTPCEPWIPTSFSGIDFDWITIFSSSFFFFCNFTSIHWYSRCVATNLQAWTLILLWDVTCKSIASNRTSDRCPSFIGDSQNNSTRRCRRGGALQYERCVNSEVRRRWWRRHRGSIKPAQMIFAPLWIDLLSGINSRPLEHFACR